MAVETTTVENEMSHEVESMAWAHEVPWHGLGNRVEGNVTIEEMLVAAGLDWSVDPVPCFARHTDGTEINIDRMAMVRSSDKKVLTIASENWKPLQNRDSLEFFRDYTRAGGATLETAGALRGGRIVWGLARVAAGFTINGNDHVKGYILLVSPHEVGKAITVRTTSVRVVCANTLAMAGGVDGHNAEYRQHHLKDFDVDAARATVALVKEGMATMELEANALQQLKMSEFDTVRVLAKFFQPVDAGTKESDSRIEALINEPTLQNSKLAGVIWAAAKAPGATPGNGWGVLNGVTYWADHIAGRSADARLFNSWLGNTAAMKKEVKKELLDMAA